MSHLPAKLRNKLERRQKTKIQLQASFRSVELKEQIENEIDSCGPDAGLMTNLLTEAHLKVSKYRPIVPLKPVSAPVAAAAPAPVMPNAPVLPPVLPVGVQPSVLPVGVQASVMPRGTSGND